MATKKKKSDAPEKKKRKPNSGSFSKDRPNPTAFQPGAPSPNPGGKPREYLALARALRAGGAGRAPDRECEAMGLPRGSSKLEVAAERILISMRRGVYPEHLEAAELFSKLTGEYAHKLELGLDLEAMEEGGGLGPRLIVQFTESEHDKLKREAEEHASGRLIDHASPPRASDPSAEAARQEAVSAASPGGAEVLPPPTATKVWPRLAAPAPEPRPESAQQTRERIYQKLYRS